MRIRVVATVTNDAVLVSTVPTTVMWLSSNTVSLSTRETRHMIHVHILTRTLLPAVPTSWVVPVVDVDVHVDIVGATDLPLLVRHCCTRILPTACSEFELAQSVWLNRAALERLLSILLGCAHHVVRSGLAVVCTRVRICICI